MVLKFKDIKPIDIIAPRNGKGTGLSYVYEIVKGLEGKIKAFNHMKLHENSAIGYHQHVEDLEVYLVTSGNGIYNNNGEIVEVSVGDITLCNKGEFHGLESKNGELEFIAIIIG